jgi:hypothetical protein
MKKRLFPILAATMIIVVTTIACGSSTPAPTLDPNAELIAFSSTRKGNNLEIYVMDTSGKSITRLTDEKPQMAHPTGPPTAQRSFSIPNAAGSSTCTS